MTVTIYVDGREDDPPIDKYKDAGFEAVTHKINKKGKRVKLILELGDYLITDGVEEIYIELKRGQDFFSSIFDGRMESQLAALSMHENSHFVIVGDPFDGHYLHYTPLTYQNAFPKSVTNTLASLGRKYEFSFRVGSIILPNMEEFQNFVLYHAKKLEQGKIYKKWTQGLKIKNDRRKTMRKKGNKEKIKRIGILMNADNIGYDKAKKLIEHFNGSAEAVLRASDKDIIAVKGIGKKAVKALRELGFDHD